MEQNIMKNQYVNFTLEEIRFAEKQLEEQIKAFPIGSQMRRQAKQSLVDVEDAMVMFKVAYENGWEVEGVTLYELIQQAMGDQVQERKVIDMEVVKETATTVSTGVKGFGAKLKRMHEAMKEVK